GSRSRVRRPPARCRPGSPAPPLTGSWVEAGSSHSVPATRGRERESGGSAPTRREGRGRAPAEQRGRSSRRVASRSAGGKGRVFPEVAEAAIVGKSRASGAQRDKIFCTQPLRPWEPFQDCSERRGWGLRCSLAEDAARPGRKNALSQRKGSRGGLFLLAPFARRSRAGD
ncbi:hypothetical protein MC885_008621, partial [Smutsia gigantea]